MTVTQSRFSKHACCAFWSVQIVPITSSVMWDGTYAKRHFMLSWLTSCIKSDLVPTSRCHCLITIPGQTDAVITEGSFISDCKSDYEYKHVSETTSGRGPTMKPRHHTIGWGSVRPICRRWPPGGSREARRCRTGGSTARDPNDTCRQCLTYIVHMKSVWVTILSPQMLSLGTVDMLIQKIKQTVNYHRPVTVSHHTPFVRVCFDIRFMCFMVITVHIIQCHLQPLVMWSIVCLTFNPLGLQPF